MLGFERIANLFTRRPFWQLLQLAVFTSKSIQPIASSEQALEGWIVHLRR